MKTLSILSAFLFLGAHVATGETTEPARSTAQVTLRADAKTVRPERVKKQNDDKKDDKAKSETVTKTIDVDISAAKSINGPLKLVTLWYARDLVAREQVLAKKVEAEVTLDDAKTAKATVPPFAFTSTPAHSKKGAGGKTEKIDASGQTFSGWVMRAYEGDILVGEAASAAPFLKLRE